MITSLSSCTTCRVERVHIDGIRDRHCAGCGAHSGTLHATPLAPTLCAACMPLSTTRRVRTDTCPGCNGTGRLQHVGARGQLALAACPVCTGGPTPAATA